MGGIPGPLGPTVALLRAGVPVRVGGPAAARDSIGTPADSHTLRAQLNGLRGEVRQILHAGRRVADARSCGRRATGGGTGRAESTGPGAIHRPGTAASREGRPTPHVDRLPRWSVAGRRG